MRRNEAERGGTRNEEIYVDCYARCFLPFHRVKRPYMNPFLLFVACVHGE